MVKLAIKLFNERYEYNSWYIVRHVYYIIISLILYGALMKERKGKKMSISYFQRESFIINIQSNLSKKKFGIVLSY